MLHALNDPDVFGVQLPPELGDPFSRRSELRLGRGVADEIEMNVLAGPVRTNFPVMKERELVRPNVNLITLDSKLYLV